MDRITSGRRLRIGIASAGRFHVLDLARELSSLGHEVTFYSYVSSHRARAFGLPPECHVSLLPLLLPLVAWQKFLPRFGRNLRERLTFVALNWAVILRMRKCDVFIFMSGIYLEAARSAKGRFGARLWLERGSRHILSQAEILADLPGEKPTALAIRRELDGYAAADRIVIASAHVEESFRRDPGAHRKLFRNPYGVDTRMFPQIKPRRTSNSLVLLYAGAWSLRKGCDVIVEAVKRCPFVRLIHAGPMGDYAFPDGNESFRHFDPVPQWELRRFYAEADAFVLASREDGFGMVLSQALASGLPIIGTDRSGAADLALTPALSERITVVPNGDAAVLAGAFAAMHRRLSTDGAFAPLADEDRECLSWEAYGRRYSAELARDLANVQNH